jgi:hypothetical protein
MALIITSGTKSKLIIQGSDIDVKKVYVRTEFAFNSNGKDVNAGLYIYSSKEAFKSKSPILNIDKLPSTGYNFQLKEQTVELAHQELKKVLTKQGFKVEIEL